MNVYEKIIEATIELQNVKIRKTGKNSYTGYNYFKIEELAPIINKICQKYKMLINIKYDNQTATMNIINAEKPEEKVEYTSPIGTTSLKGAQDIQNLGAIQTYLRRYLFLTAFNIAESDELDKMQGDKEYEKDFLIKETAALYRNFINSDQKEIDKFIEALKQKGIDSIKKSKNSLLEKAKKMEVPKN